ncbi:MAG: ABC transporter substrate-binding protein [Candidatus Cloacimonadaceae bacterium]
MDVQKRILVMLILFGLMFSCKTQKSDSRDELTYPKAASDSTSLFPIRFRPKWQTQAQFAGVYMAIHKGLYAQHGLDVQLQSVLLTEPAVDALLQGHGDIVHVDLLNALDLCREQTKIVNIAQINQKNSVYLVGKKSNGINSLEDFRGKRLGLWRSGSNMATRLFLAQKGIPMEIINIDWSINLFAQNAVDVINAMDYNEFHQILQAGIDSEDLFIAKQQELGLTVPDEGFYVRPEFYKAHPNECRAFVKATLDGWLYAFSHEQETLDLVLKMMKEDNLRANRAHQQWMLNHMKDAIMPSIAEMGILKRKNYEEAMDLMIKYMGFPRRIPYEEFYPDAE